MRAEVGFGSSSAFQLPRTLITARCCWLQPGTALTWPRLTQLSRAVGRAGADTRHSTGQRGMGSVCVCRERFPAGVGIRLSALGLSSLSCKERRGICHTSAEMQPEATSCAVCKMSLFWGLPVRSLACPGLG